MAGGVHANALGPVPLCPQPPQSVGSVVRSSSWIVQRFSLCSYFICLWQNGRRDQQLYFNLAWHGTNQQGERANRRPATTIEQHRALLHHSACKCIGHGQQPARSATFCGVAIGGPWLSSLPQPNSFSFSLPLSHSLCFWSPSCGIISHFVRRSSGSQRDRWLAYRNIDRVYGRVSVCVGAAAAVAVAHVFTAL